MNTYRLMLLTNILLKCAYTWVICDKMLYFLKLRAVFVSYYGGTVSETLYSACTPLL